MVVVLLIGGTAAVSLYLWNHANQNWEADAFRDGVHSIRQQAGVVGALAAVVFMILTALEKGQQAVSAVAATVPVFGQRPSDRAPQQGASSPVPQAV